MPLAALALKENLCGAVWFKTCDKEYSTASLGDSEVTSIQSAPRCAIPDPVQFTEEPEEIAAAIATEEPRDVLQHNPPRASLLHKGEVSERQTGSLAVKSSSFACDAEVLARESAAIDICLWDVICLYLRNAAQIRSVWESLCQHRASVRVYLANADRLDAGTLKAEV
jgi:hypothetical protein